MTLCTLRCLGGLCVEKNVLTQRLEGCTEDTEVMIDDFVDFAIDLDFSILFCAEKSIQKQLFNFIRNFLCSVALHIKPLIHI